MANKYLPIKKNSRPFSEVNLDLLYHLQKGGRKRLQIGFHNLIFACAVIFLNNNFKDAGGINYKTATEL